MLDRIKEQEMEILRKQNLRRAKLQVAKELVAELEDVLQGLPSQDVNSQSLLIEVSCRLAWLKTFFVFMLQKNYIQGFNLVGPGFRLNTVLLRTPLLQRRAHKTPKKLSPSFYQGSALFCDQSLFMHGVQELGSGEEDLKASIAEAEQLLKQAKSRVKALEEPFSVEHFSTDPLGQDSEKVLRWHVPMNSFGLCGFLLQ